MEMRCQHKLHGIIDGDVIEVKCGSALCGAKPGVVVLHRFSASNGGLIETRRFKDPTYRKESSSGRGTPVWTQGYQADAV